MSDLDDVKKSGYLALAIGLKNKKLTGMTHKAISDSIK